MRMKVIFFLILATMIPHFMSDYYRSDEVRKSFFYNLYIPVEVLCIYYFFRTSINSINLRRVIDVSLVVSFITGMYVFDHYFFEKRFYGEWVGVNNIIYTGWILLLLVQIYAEDTPFDTHQPIFWFVLGLFLFASSTSVVYALYNYMLNPQHKQLKSIKLVSSFFNIVMYLCWAYCFYLYKPQKSLSNA